jgi:hypothetical protein
MSVPAEHASTPRACVGVGIKNDQSTRQPVEGDVVDADRDFSELCARMRETGRSACTILFCDQDVYIEADEGRSGEHSLGFTRSA